MLQGRWKNKDFIILNLVFVLLSREFAGFENKIYLQILTTFFNEKKYIYKKYHSCQYSITFNKM